MCQCQEASTSREKGSIKILIENCYKEEEKNCYNPSIRNWLVKDTNIEI